MQSKKSLIEDINSAKQLAANEFLKKIKQEKKEWQDRIWLIQTKGVEGMHQYEEEQRQKEIEQKRQVEEEKRQKIRERLEKQRKESEEREKSIRESK